MPRWVNFRVDTGQYELHGFSDASTRAYAAAVYLQVTLPDESVTVTLLVAKSKVAPIKTLSVPRLELSAALLLARLVVFVRDAFQNHAMACRCWTDSTITLAWVSKAPTRWKTFVANRVAEIQTLLPGVPWRHVSTRENPADCASRGISPDDLIGNDLWWSGPSWLKLPTTSWPAETPAPHADAPLEEKRIYPACTIVIIEPWELSKRYSSWFKLLRVTAYIMRFAKKLRARVYVDANVIPTKSDKPENVLVACQIAIQPDEMHQATCFWIKRMQQEMFPIELVSITTGAPLKKTSPLASLNPFCDPDGVIRVGGRLQKSALSEKSKHPVILRSHPLLDLMISDFHRKALHAGSQLTLTLLREEFWILRARTTVRAVLYRCVQCARERAAVSTELMGNLPEVRVTRSARAFTHTGVDYAGPILVRTAPGRGHKSHKAYIALFVCLTTRAIHLELVSDYTTDAFLAEFNRFSARRGVPLSMYSDNGTTFQGADRELRQTFLTAIQNPNLVSKLSTDRVAWHFLPPAAPHFGGLWEAGVRSVKHHLKRCVGNHTLTFEELATLLCRIEACLNSRPIAALSENFDDYQALTPGHFLIGSGLMAVPEPSTLDLNENRLSRWQLIQQMHESFWKAWTNDYLQTLHQRAKWRTSTRLAEVGKIVLLRSALVPPSQWELGRIAECHPGEDGVTRVVTVATARSRYKRPITKLVFLPVDINKASEIESGTAGGNTS